MNKEEVKKHFINTSLKKSFNVNKESLRARLSSQSTSHQQNDNNLNELSKSNVENYLNALEIADKHYNISVSQGEVNEYIKDNISGIKSKEKEKYAKSIGITEYQLDYAFDRDFYIMDTLWEKIIPVLMDEYPKEKNEADNDYYDRIKSEFYDNKISSENKS